ncbi:MAG: hypothetical protein ACHRXM_11715 [Isosphaerales bacterium]
MRANPQGIADPPAPTLGASRATVFTRTSRPSAGPAPHHGRTTSGFWASKPVGSPLPLTVALPSIVGRQETVILIPLAPLAPPSEQDLTLLATEHLRPVTKRARTSPRGCRCSRNPVFAPRTYH